MSAALAYHDIGDPHPYFRRWVSPRIDRLQNLSVRADREYQRLYEGDAHDDFRANTWVREIYDAVRPFFGSTVAGANLDEAADALASRFDSAIKRVEAGAATWGGIYRKALDFCQYVGISAPHGQSIQSRMLRLASARWWRRKVGTMVARIVDQTGRKLGEVHADRDIYLSDAALTLHRARAAATTDLLAELQAVNNVGQTFNLADLANRSLSKPAIRRTELMVRLRGLEEHAERLKWGALFVTLTAPSKYHAYVKGKGANDGYNLADPRAVNDYLGRVWSRIRSRLAYRSLEVFGCRVAEPHHDGTPHWHFIIFARAEALLQVETLFYRYGLAEDGREPGALKRRVTVERINSAKGSATAYVAKYVAKNIDGHRVNRDRYGKPARPSAERISAWSKVWGIRQFQFFGAAPIGPWRELRRVRRETFWPYEAARTAADSACYADYLNEWGIHRFKPFRDPFVDPVTGECDAPYNAYGEVRKPPIRGLLANVADIQPLVTRLCTWTISRKPDASNARPGPGAWTCVNNCTPDEGYQFDLALAQPPPEVFTIAAGG